MRKIAILIISLVTALTSFAPAQAFPTVAAKTQIGSSDVIQVGDHRGRNLIIRRNYRSQGWRNDRGWRSDRGWRRDSYNHRRYDRGNNAGAIIGGFAAGAIIGGALSAQPRRYYNGDSHVQSCYARYRSYRAYDNTFQPNNGPRRQCR